MKLLIEPLIIFMVGFFPGLFFSLTNLSWESNQVLAFSQNQEVFRIITYNVPILCLIWYFLLKEPIRSALGPLKPRKKDFFQAIKVMIGLLIIGASVSVIINLMIQNDVLGLHIPGIIPWVIILISCIITGYTEESYFRVYLINHLSLSGIPLNKALVSSCMLFALCHVYQGPIGLLSSGLAGFFLSYVYIKRRSIHGIALGHGLYNLLSYVLAHFYSVSGVSI
ncbi:MAG: CPBP family intramembrane metalloprotease [Treponema sp.]|jgi:membrane protease YdiL (CAAX protease family)|nr:CPBP family intramembrane metalloprotease [Treponema sp.]